MNPSTSTQDKATNKEFAEAQSHAAIAYVRSCLASLLKYVDHDEHAERITSMYAAIDRLNRGNP